MYTLRPATPADADLLFALYAEPRAAEVRGWGFPEPMIAGFVAQQYRARAASWAAQFPGAVDHVVMVEGEAAGRVLLEGAETLRVVDVALTAAHRGRGLGTAILTDLQARGRPIRLSVAVGNPARRLYERLGFSGSDDGVYATLEWSP